MSHAASGDLQYAMFSRSEMGRRYARIREMMGQKGIDALFVTGEENFQYLAGAAASLAFGERSGCVRVVRLAIPSLTMPADAPCRAASSRKLALSQVERGAGGFRWRSSKLLEKS